MSTPTVATTREPGGRRASRFAKGRSTTHRGVRLRRVRDGGRGAQVGRGEAGTGVYRLVAPVARVQAGWRRRGRGRPRGRAGARRGLGLRTRTKQAAEAAPSSHAAPALTPASSTSPPVRSGELCPAQRVFPVRAAPGGRIQSHCRFRRGAHPHMQLHTRSAADIADGVYRGRATPSRRRRRPLTACCSSRASRGMPPRIRSGPLRHRAALDSDPP